LSFIAPVGTLGELEELFSVSRSTIYRAIGRCQARQGPPG
jgi:predicted DNA-binding protein YlxM (UPF0122 family)